MENLELADRKARRGKKKCYGIANFDKHRMENLLALQHALRTCSYRTSEYERFTIKDPKERVISRLPYFPDRICHHALMNVLEPLFVRTFTRDTYACIKGRGIHAAVRRIKEVLSSDRNGTRYCLKLDIRHYYPSIDHSILKSKMRKVTKDIRVLRIFDEIIESSDGLPIGNYTSQYLANLYLSDFDHWIKESKKVRYYFRYVDDIVVFSDSKEFLHELKNDIDCYISNNLLLELKGNWQVFPVDARGVDFLGYVFRHDYTLLRKRIKLNIKKKTLTCVRKGMSIEQTRKMVGSYQGWTNYCNSMNFKYELNKLCHGKVFK